MIETDNITIRYSHQEKNADHSFDVNQSNDGVKMAVILKGARE